MFNRMAMSKNQFIINDLITLKLENGRTNIYIKDEIFDQCKSLLFINTYLKSDQESIDSIDEAAETLLSDLERDSQPQDFGITPEIEFWGHCSNLQTWAEHNYDSRILHRNLAFPLLKKLAELGDSIAKRVFKEEIAKRFNCGFLPVIKYLIRNNYLSFFNREELNCLIEGFDFNIIKNRSKFLKLISNNVNIANLFSEKELQRLILQKILYKSAHQAKYRDIPQILMSIEKHFGLEISFYNFSVKLLDVLWNLIKDTTDNIIAGMCASIAVLCYHKGSISIISICRFLDINVSDIYNHVNTRIFRKFNASDSFSFVQSFDSLKEIIERLDEKLI